MQEFDIPYLRALLEDDSTWYLHVEGYAKSLGFGPLVPCTFAASPNEQKSSCRNYCHLICLFSILIHFTAHWHRDADNKLRQGILLKGTHKCKTTYDIYVPDNLYDCPQVLIVSRNPHDHPPPLPIKTPPQIVDYLESLLLRLDWKLADATPRRLALDSGFVHSLREALGWTNYERDPSPHDLHPSLGNLDHLRRIINKLRSFNFPHGTGFHGWFSILIY